MAKLSLMPCACQTCDPASEFTYAWLQANTTSQRRAPAQISYARKKPEPKPAVRVAQHEGQLAIGEVDPSVAEFLQKMGKL